MVKLVLFFPVYVPDAILIVSPSEAEFIASFNVLNAVSGVFPSPLDLLTLTYQLFPAHNISSLDTFKVSVSFVFEFILLLASKLLTSLLTETISLVELFSALTTETAKKQISIIKNKHRFFNIFSPPIKKLFKYNIICIKCA